MTEFCIKLADTVIGIRAVYPYLRTFCGEYLTEEIPAFRITMSREEILAEQKRAEEEASAGEYTEPYLETLAVYRKIAVKMLERNTLLFHGSVVAVGEEAYLFTALSGTGKTTHTRLWLERIPDSWVVNGDKPLLCCKDGRVYACGTPWQGKENYGCNRMVPLKAICILERDAENHIRKVSAQEALPALFQQSYRPEEPAAMLKTMELLGLISEHCRFYRLGCNMEPQAALVSYEGMK